MGCTSVLVNSTNLLAWLIFPPIDSAAAPNRSLGSGLQQNVIAGMKDTGSDDERFESGPAAATPFAVHHGDSRAERARKRSLFSNHFWKANIDVDVSRTAQPPILESLGDRFHLSNPGVEGCIVFRVANQ